MENNMAFLMYTRNFLSMRIIWFSYDRTRLDYSRSPTSARGIYTCIDSVVLIYLESYAGVLPPGIQIDIFAELGCTSLCYHARGSD